MIHLAAAARSVLPSPHGPYIGAVAAASLAGRAATGRPFPPSYHGDPDISALFPRPAVEALLDNGLRIARGERADDLAPVLKLSVPFDGAAWLLLSILPRMPGLAFGIVDEGCGNPKHGYAVLATIAAARGDAGFPVERCLHFEAEGDFAWYLSRAECHGTIET